MFSARRVLPVLALAGVAATALACSSGGGSGDTTGSDSPASTATVTTVTSTAPASGSTPTATGGSTSRPMASGSPKSPGTAACTTARLRLAGTGSNGAAGTNYLSWTLTNTGTSTCSMTGYVGFSALDASGRIIGKPADRDPGAVPEGATGSGPITVTLIPNAHAQFVVSSIDAVPNQFCTSQQTSTAVQVFPPNQTSALRVPAKFTVCGMKVGPLRPVS